MVHRMVETSHVDGERRSFFSLESLSLSTASVDNVGIFYKMIHFSGVVIGKKTDKFYLSSEEEEKFMSFCAGDSEKSSSLSLRTG